MTSLTNPVTGHAIETDDESVDFWTSAGYRAEAKKEPAKKTTKSPASKTSK